MTIRSRFHTTNIRSERANDTTSCTPFLQNIEFKTFLMQADNGDQSTWFSVAQLSGMSNSHLDSIDEFERLSYPQTTSLTVKKVKDIFTINK